MNEIACWPHFYHLHIKDELPRTVNLDCPYRLRLVLTNELDGFQPADIDAAAPLSLECTLVSGDSSVNVSDVLEIRKDFKNRPLLQKSGQGIVLFILGWRTSCQTQLRKRLIQEKPLMFLNVTVSAPSTVKDFGILSACSSPFTVGAGMCSANEQAVQTWSHAMGSGYYHSFSVPPCVRLPPDKAQPLNAVLPVKVVIKEVCGYKIGGRIWDCSMYFQEYIADVLDQRYVPHLDFHFFEGKRVLELGSGTGALGIWLWRTLCESMQANGSVTTSCSKLASSVTPCVHLTDLPEVMELLDANVTMNRNLEPSASSVCELSCRPLIWGNPISPQEPYDVIIACDCLYNPIYFPALIKVLSG